MPTSSVVLPDTGPIAVQVPIRPRWEWRVFEKFPGSFIGALAPRVDGIPSLEIYILSAESPHNVKVRGGQLDVKVLEGTERSGLELWRPVFKRAFPISAGDLPLIWNAWGIPAVTPERPTYTLDDFLLEIVAPRHADLRAVSVAKVRARLTQFACSAERALLTVEGSRWETFALEDEDPERVVTAQASIGAERPGGSNYPAWLKGVVGMTGISTPSQRVSI